MTATAVGPASAASSATVGLSIDELRAAQRRIAPWVRQTPVMRWGQDLWLKLEQLQVTGSFKARGACSRLFAETSSPPGGVVTASGGNHGLGVAYAASARGLAATVYLPLGAPRSTEARLGEYGAKVVRHGRDWDEAWDAARSAAEAQAALLVHPFADPLVIAGQGTVGLELVEQLGAFEVVVVAVGGGGFIGGVALAIKSLLPQVRVVGVEPAGAAAMKEALAAGQVVSLSRVETIAGTLAPRQVSPLTLDLARRFVDQVVLVSDDELRSAMRRLWRELHLLVEPAAAAAVAALDQLELSHRRVAVLLCGANLDAAQATFALEGGR